MQLSPRFTGASGSPLTATICPPLVAIWMPQPVPQKRQTPLSQLQPASAAFACASASWLTVMPTVAAVAAAIPDFMNARRVRLVMFAPRRIRPGAGGANDGSG